MTLAACVTLNPKSTSYNQLVIMQTMAGVATLWAYTRSGRPRLGVSKVERFG